MEKVMEIIQRKEFIIAIIAICIALIIYVILRQNKIKKYRKELSEYEVRYNSIRSIPLSFKLNKACAIARVNEEAMQAVNQFRDDYDKCQSNIKAIASTLADTDDLISVGKLKDVKDNLLDIESMLEIGEKQTKQLNEFLDHVLEKETAQREEVTVLKDKFRTLKQQIYDNNSKLSFSFKAIENKIQEAEKLFSSFEEWMYASEFDKAGVVLDDIKQLINQLEGLYTDLPSLIQDARGIIPNLIEEINREYTMALKASVYLKHLEIDSNIEIIQDSLNHDLQEIKDGNILGVKDHLNDMKVRLNQLQAQINKENNAYVEMRDLLQNIDEVCDQLETNCKKVNNLYPLSKDRFGLIDKEESIVKLNAKKDEIIKTQSQILQMIQSNTVPSSTILISCKELLQDIEITNSEILQINNLIDRARSDEDRANRQLLKLQLIMNEMQVKIIKNKLPAISASYDGDLVKANEYVKKIEQLLNESPLNTNVLNVTLNNSIDFIYKLYNNVNNVVGMAIMVENAIVFGNKYRSEYPDVDSELTRAELCYRNGEYTQALTIAIASIEKLFPGSYETMIKENALSAN